MTIAKRHRPILSSAILGCLAATSFVTDSHSQELESPFNFDDGTPCIYPEVTSTHVDAISSETLECIPDFQPVSSCLVGSWFLDLDSFSNNARRLFSSNPELELQQASGSSSLRITPDGFVRECHESYILATTSSGGNTAIVNTFMKGTKLTHVISGNTGRGSETRPVGQCFESLYDNTVREVVTKVNGQEHRMVLPPDDLTFLGINAVVSCSGDILDITYYPDGEEYLEYRYHRQ